MEFLSEVWSELKKVVWPTKKEIVKYTLTVIVFSVVIAIFLGLVDIGILKIFENIV